METQVDQVVQLLLDGETATTKKVARKFRCGSSTNVLSKAIDRIERMGIRVKRIMRPVRGKKKVMFYTAEV